MRKGTCGLSVYESNMSGFATQGCLGLLVQKKTFLAVGPSRCTADR